MLIGKWNKSVILTYVGLLFSVIGIYLSVKGGNVVYVLSCLVLAGVCDMFDGYVARKCKRDENEKNFGIQLDSLVDTVSFVVFPIVILLGMGLNKWYNIVIYVLFGICGVCRLAYFNILVEDNSKPAHSYKGLPVTAAAAIFPTFYLLKYVLSKSCFNIVYSLVMLITAILNILNINIKKPKGRAYLVFSIAAILALVLFLVIL